jgi:hypothetical protein
MVKDTFKIIFVIILYEDQNQKRKELRDQNQKSNFIENINP